MIVEEKNFVNEDQYFEINKEGYLSGFKDGFTGSPEYVMIPEGVTKIGNRAFSHCDCILEIWIPDGVINIEDNAFRCCSNLSKVRLPKGLCTIGKSSFMDCCNLTHIQIPDSVREIGDMAFGGCGDLEMIRIPEGVEKIGSFTFCECWNLSDIYIPNSVREIGESAFSSCENLTQIQLPKSLTVIGKSAFSHCENLKEIIIPNGVKRLEENTFNCCESLTKIKLPKGIVAGEHAFGQYSSMKKVDSSDTKDQFDLYRCHSGDVLYQNNQLEKKSANTMSYEEKIYFMHKHWENRAHTTEREDWYRSLDGPIDPEELDTLEYIYESNSLIDEPRKARLTTYNDAYDDFDSEDFEVENPDPENDY